MVSAFRDGAKNSLVIVGLKEGGPGRVQIALSDPAFAPAKWEVYLTTRTLDCQQVDSVGVRNGIATLDLPEEAVLTLVSAGD